MQVKLSITKIMISLKLAGIEYWCLLFLPHLCYFGWQPHLQVPQSFSSTPPLSNILCPQYKFSTCPWDDPGVRSHYSCPHQDTDGILLYPFCTIYIWYSLFSAFSLISGVTVRYINRLCLPSTKMGLCNKLRGGPLITKRHLVQGYMNCDQTVMWLQIPQCFFRFMISQQLLSVSVWN